MQESLPSIDIKLLLKNMQSLPDNILKRPSLFHDMGFNLPSDNKSQTDDSKDDSNDNNIIYEGYLENDSLYFKTFRKRWIVLKGNCLYSFKNKDDKKSTETLDLKLVLGAVKS
eukprot:110180_1